MLDVLVREGVETMIVGDPEDMARVSAVLPQSDLDVACLVMRQPGKSEQRIRLPGRISPHVSVRLVLVVLDQDTGEFTARLVDAGDPVRHVRTLGYLEARATAARLVAGTCEMQGYGDVAAG